MATTFDRLDPEALRAFALAQDEAVRLGHEYLGSEHLLLGVLREGTGLGAQALGALGLELGALRAFIESAAGRGSSRGDKIVMTEQGHRTLEVAHEEALGLGDANIRTEHVALGIARQQEGLAHTALSAAGITLDLLREKVVASRS